MTHYLDRPDISEVFAKNDKGLQKYFKFFCKQQKSDLDDDVNFRLENMHAKTFTKLAYQSKIIPGITTVDDVNSTFRNIVRHYKAGRHDGSKYSMFIDFGLFKRALVRLGLVG